MAGYDSTIPIDDDIDDYDIAKCDDILENFVTKDALYTALRNWLTEDQYVQFVGDNFGWDEIRRDDIDDEEEEEEDPFFDDSDIDWADGGDA